MRTLILPIIVIIALSSFSLAVTQSDLDKSLIHEWFTAGCIQDDTFGTADFTFSGTPDNVTDPSGQTTACFFNSTHSEFARIDSTPANIQFTGAGSFTIEAWYKSTGSSLGANGAALFGFWGNNGEDWFEYDVYSEFCGGSFAGAGNGQRAAGADQEYCYTTEVTMSTDNWIHYLITYNASGATSLQVYVNNTLVDSRAKSSDWDAWGAGQRWRLMTDLESGFADGSVASLRIYNKSLNSSEIAFLYSTSFSSTSPPTLSNLNCRTCGDDETPPYTTEDTTPVFNFTTNKNAWCRFGDEDLNYTGMGAARNNTCIGEGTTSHTCTLDPSDELISPADYVYIGCIDSSGNENATSSSGPLEMDLTGLEANGDGAILAGIHNSSIWPGASIIKDEMIYTHDKNNNQAVGTVDYFAISGNQQWGFNYVTDGESHTGLINLSPVLYIWEGANLTTEEIVLQVSSLINGTKS